MTIYEKKKAVIEQLENIYANRFSEIPNVFITINRLKEELLFMTISEACEEWV